MSLDLLLNFLILLIIAAVCGAIGAALAGYTSRGCTTNIILGFIGALIGTWISNILKINDFLYWERIPIFWSIVGSAVFVAFISILTRGRPRRRR